MRNMTATEVRMRVAEFERTQAPKLQASIEAGLAEIYDDFSRVFWAHWNDRELQQQRMTDDGCPLAGPIGNRILSMDINWTVAGG